MRLWPTPTFPPRNPGPINAEAHSLPTDDRVAVHQVQGLSPRGPDSGKNDPKQSVFPLQSRHSLPSLEHSQLLSQSQVLQGQGTALSKSCPNQNSQPSQSLDHGLECGGSRLDNQYLSSMWSFGEPHATDRILSIEIRLKTLSREEFWYSFGTLQRSGSAKYSQGYHLEALNTQLPI
jgi:hypothetical protein